MPTRGTYGFYSGLQKNDWDTSQIGRDQTDRENKRRALDLEQEKLDMLKKEREDKKYEGRQFTPPDPLKIPSYAIADSGQLVHAASMEMVRIQESNLPEEFKQAAMASLDYITPQYEAFGSQYQATVNAYGGDEITLKQKDELNAEIDGLMPGQFKSSFNIDDKGAYGLTLKTKVNGEDVEYSYAEAIEKMNGIQSKIMKFEAYNKAYDAAKSVYTKNAALTDDAFGVQAFSGRTANAMIATFEQRGLSRDDAERAYNEIREELILREPAVDASTPDKPVGPYEPNVIPTVNKNHKVGTPSTPDEPAFQVSVHPNKDKRSAMPINLRRNSQTKNLTDKDFFQGQPTQIKYDEAGEILAIEVFVPNDMAEMQAMYLSYYGTGQAENMSKEEIDSAQADIIENLDGNLVTIDMREPIESNYKNKEEFKADRKAWLDNKTEATQKFRYIQENVNQYVQDTYRDGMTVEQYERFLENQEK